MINSLPMHTATKNAIDGFRANPSQALIIDGAAGSNKYAIAEQLAADLLQADIDKLKDHPHLILVQPEEKRSIGIDQIRNLLSRLSLVVPTAAEIKRVIIIRNAEAMTEEAQNALLKALEEPPEGTILILLTNKDSLLPTIKSRSQTIRALPPSDSALTEYFTAQGHSADKITQALAISGGLPRLTADILADDQHNYLIAADRAKTILKQSPYDRLINLDDLTKEPLMLNSTLSTLARIAEYSIARGAKDVIRWQSILQAVHRTQQELTQNVQPKLALTNLMLSI